MSTRQYPKRRETDADREARESQHSEDWRKEWAEAVFQKFNAKLQISSEYGQDNRERRRHLARSEKRINRFLSSR